MARRTDGWVRFRPVGSSRHPRTPVRYSPGGTGCPAIEQAIEQLYHGQNEESFWALMGALNYALELETHVLVPLQTAPGTPPTPAPWAENPVPQQKARGLALWTLKNKDRTWLPLFTSSAAACMRRTSTAWSSTRGATRPHWMRPCSTACSTRATTRRSRETKK